MVYEILLVHKPRIHDAWQLPQGGIEAGENLEQAALRELQEETSLHFEKVTHICKTEYTYDFPPQFLQKYNPVNAGQTLFFVMINVPERPTVTVDNDEIDNFTWVLPKQLPQYIKRKEYVDVILKAMGECVIGL